MRHGLPWSQKTTRQGANTWIGRVPRGPSFWPRLVSEGQYYSDQEDPPWGGRNLTTASDQVSEISLNLILYIQLKSSLAAQFWEFSCWIFLIRQNNHAKPPLRLRRRRRPAIQSHTRDSLLSLYWFLPAGSHLSITRISGSAFHVRSRSRPSPWTGCLSWHFQAKSCAPRPGTSRNVLEPIAMAGPSSTLLLSWARLIIGSL